MHRQKGKVDRQILGKGGQTDSGERQTDRETDRQQGKVDRQTVGKVEQTDSRERRTDR